MKKILVTGGYGLVGSEFKGEEYLKIGSKYCDLRDTHNTNNLFLRTNFDSVIHCAAKVGGVGGNMRYKGEFFYDNIMIKERVDVDNYNFINMGVQGAELKVLKGAINILHKIDYIYSEVNVSELYEGCVLIEEMDNFLKSFGFERVETDINEYDWGDALFIKRG